MSFTVFSYNATVLLIQPNQPITCAGKCDPTHGWTQLTHVHLWVSTQLRVLALDTSSAFDSVDHATLTDSAHTVLRFHDVAFDWLWCFVTEPTHRELKQDAQLSPRDRAMRRVSWNVVNCHATVHKLLVRQVLTKSMVWSWRFSWRQCVVIVINMCTQPWRDRVALIVS